MPKAKRQKLISLTKTTPRGTKEHKKTIVEEIRKTIDKYQNLYVLDIENLRTSHVKELRKRLHEATPDGCRIFMTKNKVMQIALGKSAAEEHQKDVHLVSQQLQGICALVCTKMPLEQLTTILTEFRKADFARSGAEVEETVELPEGCVDWMPSSYEERMVRLGLPIEIKNGKVHLRYAVTVCKEGDKLTPEASKILRHFGYRLAVFHLRPRCHWNSQSGFKMLEAAVTPKPQQPPAPPRVAKKAQQEEKDDDEEQDGEESDDEGQQAGDESDDENMS